jgi:hypothetical protein
MQGGQPPFGGPPGHVPGMNNGMIPPGQPFGNMPHPGMHNPMDGQQPQPPQQPGIARPSREHLQAAMAHIAKLKTDYSPERMLANVPAIDVPAEQRMEYNTVLEQLHRACTDLDHKLPMLFAVLKKEDVVRRLVIIVQTAIQQRAMISSGSARFLVTLETLRTMLQQVQHMNESFATILAGLVGKGPMPPGGPMGGMPPRPPLNHPLPPPQVNQLNQPPSIPPQPTNSIPPQPQPPNRPLTLQPPPNRMKRPGTAGPPNAPSPTPPPVASASTPVNNAPTPRDMSSPQAPKSPKGKPKPKPPQKRKPSIKAPAAPPLPPPEPATAPSPAGSNKRPREEEASPPQHNMQASTSSNAPGPSVANEPSPPKRLKTEWDGPPNEAIKEREQQVANVKTEEDGAAFLEQMTELFKMAAGNDGQDDFSETLDTIFKGFGASTDDSAGGSMSLGMGGDGGVSQDGGPPPLTDEFVEFFDFSSFGTLDEDDAGSKAATPDLVSSSTNPSPESNNSEVDAAHQALTSSDVKSEDFTDHLRLGVWKEVDGGESAYFQSGQWKWDSPMQSLDQPWAIFNS